MSLTARVSVGEAASVCGAACTTRRRSHGDHNQNRGPLTRFHHSGTGRPNKEVHRRATSKSWSFLETWTRLFK